MRGMFLKRIFFVAIAFNLTQGWNRRLRCLFINKQLYTVGKGKLRSDEGRVPLTFTMLGIKSLPSAEMFLDFFFPRRFRVSSFWMNMNNKMGGSWASLARILRTGERISFSFEDLHINKKYPWWLPFIIQWISYGQSMEDIFYVDKCSESGKS